MTDITIKEFSKTVGLPVNRLIDQLELAGVKKKKESDLISDEEKMQLLNYFRNSQIKNKATKATTNLPTTADGTKFKLFPALIIVAPAARPADVTNPRISPYIFPNFTES